MDKIIGNQQLYQLTAQQLQVFLTSQLGDGCIATSNSNSTYYVTNCIYEEYIDFKKELLGDMFKKKDYLEHNGYCQTPIYVMRSCSSDILAQIKKLPIKSLLDNLDDLGIALWFYDDGSLHKKELWYNLNTQKFPKEIQENIFIPYFNSIGIYPKLRKEIKKDGRVFYYLCINKYDGAYEISKILEKYPLECYSYKRWSSETIQKWSKFQEKLKSEGIDIRQLPKQTKGKLFKELSI